MSFSRNDSAGGWEDILGITLCNWIKDHSRLFLMPLLFPYSFICRFNDIRSGSCALKFSLNLVSFNSNI